MIQARICVYMAKGVMNIKIGDSTHGAPLAVCVNDCMLDYGQPGEELMRVCFQVRCAFAEMRWGRPAPIQDPRDLEPNDQPATIR